MHLSKNFTLEELTRSTTAAARGICNTPPAAALHNLRRLAADVLQPLREAYGKPIRVGSGYRSAALNKAVGGARTSQHLYGQAADITALSDSRADNRELFDTALRLMREGRIKVGQLIDEYDYNRVHISTPGSHVNQVLHIK